MTTIYFSEGDFGRLAKTGIEIFQWMNEAGHLSIAVEASPGVMFVYLTPGVPVGQQEEVNRLLHDGKLWVAQLGISRDIVVSVAQENVMNSAAIREGVAQTLHSLGVEVGGLDEVKFDVLQITPTEMEIEGDYFQYLEDHYEAQAKSLEGLKLHVGFADDDPDLLEFARSKNYFPATNQLDWTKDLAEVFSMRWQDRDEKRTTYYWFGERTVLNIFNATYEDGESSVFVVTLEAGEFGVEFVVRFDETWHYEIKWVKEEQLFKQWLQAPRAVIAVHSSNDVYLEPTPGWIAGFD